MQTKEAYDVIVQHSKALIQTVAALAQKHRSTLMMGKLMAFTPFRLHLALN